MKRAPRFIKVDSEKQITKQLYLVPEALDYAAGDILYVSIKENECLGPYKVSWVEHTTMRAVTYEVWKELGFDNDSVAFQYYRNNGYPTMSTGNPATIVRWK